MVRGFSRKKIKSSKTLAEIFRKTRQKKDVTIEEAEIKTKVKAKYLIALEAGDWTSLPSDVYLRGFVLAYAKYLDLDITEVLEKYESDFLFFLQGKGQHKAKISYNQVLHEKKVLITPKILAYFSLSVFVFSMFGYILLQVLEFAGNPTLKILSPDNNAVIESDIADLSGITDTDTLVVVNNENVPVTNDGHFLLKLKLHRGVNVIKVKAVNKAKKETAHVFTVEYKPKTAAIDNNLAN